ncbi:MULTISPECIES: type 4b pilus protein PilO2 [Asaia]|uniref:Type 4b pilus protein PilO2 n=1 Tax=Asaia spathodeae TaxID=657016 RepID=A0ABX2P840_9PROT|nr:type 4b pilus protein PilO2 [Asaia spathodeae]GBR20251.1 hypothetical protein AA105894_2513 [Asaia spathodeae NBRC 105894]
MSIDLRTDDGHHWVLDATWIIVPRKPSHAALRNQARALEATHYGIFGNKPYSIGFFNFRQYGDKRKTANPLAPVLAQTLGPNVYAEFTLDDGSVWYLATDGEGQLKAGTDRVISIDNRDAIRKRYDEERFSDRRYVDSAGLEKLIAPLSEVNVNLYSASLTSHWKPVAAGLSAVLLCAAGTHIIQVHNERVRQEEARKALALARLRAEQERRLHLPVATSVWVQACMITAMRQRIFQDGWTQTSWTCSGDTLNIEWARTGGTVGSAPAGTIAQDGETIKQAVHLPPLKSAPTALQGTGGVKQLVAFLQLLGVRPQVSIAMNPGPPPGLNGGPYPDPIAANTLTRVEWTLTSDPRSAFWSKVPGLTIQTLHHVNRVAGGNVSDATAYSFDFSATVSEPVSFPAPN